MFSHLLAYLPYHVIVEFQDVATSTSEIPYSNLKRAIIDRSKKPAAFHRSQLLQKVNNAKPSTMLARLRRHFKKLCPFADMELDPILKTSFLQSLSCGTIQHLLLQQDQSLSHLANIADQ